LERFGDKAKAHFALELTLFGDLASFSLQQNTRMDGRDFGDLNLAAVGNDNQDKQCNKQTELHFLKKKKKEDVIKKRR